jgi:hypothetical protein
MIEIAHAAIDAGADIVVGHGPHFSLPVELYRGKPICYGLGSFSFHTGHGGHRHGDWLGLMARARCSGAGIERLTLQFVRHDAENRTVLRQLQDEAREFEQIARESATLGVRLVPAGDEAVVARET